MKVDVENLSSVKKKLTFTLDEKEIAKELGKVYSEVKKTAHIKGFRPGKAPKSILDRHLKDSIHDMTSQNLVNDTFKDFSESNELKFIGEPELDVPDLDPEKPLTFTVTYEVEPEPEITGYKGVEIEVSPLEIDDEMIDGELERAREQFAVIKELETERKPVDGDLLMIRLWQEEDRTGDEPPSIEAEFRPGRMKQEFYDALKDMMPGEDKVIEVGAMGDEPARNRLISLVSIKEKVLPELDDELAKDLGASNVEELKEKTCSDLEKRLDAENEQQVNLKILEKLSELNPFEIPESALTNHTRSKIRDEDLSKLDPKLRDSIMKMFEMDIKGTYILDSIAKTEGIEPTDQQIEDKTRELAENSGRNYDKVKADFERAEVKAGIKSRLKRELALDFLRENANIKVMPGETESRESEQSEEP